MEQTLASHNVGLCGSHAPKRTSVFISGKIRGLNFDQVVNKFDNKAKQLREQGYDVVNPVERILLINYSRARLGQPALTDDDNIREIMGICLHDMLQCDELHLLPDWNQSDGAMLERDVALRMRIVIVYP